MADHESVWKRQEVGERVRADFSYMRKEIANATFILPYSFQILVFKFRADAEDDSAPAGEKREREGGLFDSKSVAILVFH